MLCCTILLCTATSLPFGMLDFFENLMYGTVPSRVKGIMIMIITASTRALEHIRGRSYWNQGHDDDQNHDHEGAGLGGRVSADGRFLPIHFFFFSTFSLSFFFHALDPFDARCSWMQLDVCWLCGRLSVVVKCVHSGPGRSNAG